MRMMLKVTVPVEKGNETIADGSLPRKMQAILGDLKPEAAYFLAFDGKRTALIFLDLAEIDFYPVMNAEDLGKGLPASLEQLRKYQ